MKKNIGYRYKETLNESQESESIKAARILYMQKRGVDAQEADRWVRIDLRGDIPALRSKQGGKFILGVTRMFLDGQLRSAQDIEGVNTAIQYASSEVHIKEYDRNLNGLTAQQFIEKFADAANADADADRAARSQEQYTNESDYQIVPINSFEEAQRYSDYTTWCITHHENMFDSYTSNGIAQFYFCLRNGFEKVPQRAGRTVPLDEYGLSMIAVCVDNKGRLKTCTCRWNHDKGGNDHVMNTQQISEVINMNFYEVFKPNTKWEDSFAEMKQGLASGKELHQLFEYVSVVSEGLTKVKWGGNYNFIDKNRQFISDNWFDMATDFANGLAAVRNGHDWKIINTNGEYITEESFMNIQWRNEDHEWEAINVQRFDRLWYLLNNKGQVISKFGWEEIDHFSEGWARVKYNGQFTYINQRNELINNQWYVEANPFHNGFACVFRPSKGWNYLTTDGKHFLPDNYADYLRNFRKDGRAFIRVNGKWGLITNEQEILCDPMFDYVDSHEANVGVARVDIDGMNNYIDTETGKLLLDRWCYNGKLPRKNGNDVYADVYWDEDDLYPQDICIKRNQPKSLLQRLGLRNEGKTIIISERQTELLKEHILNEGLSPVIYHFTDVAALFGIITNNKFYLKSGIFGNGSDLGGGKRMFYLSTTRNRNANEGYSRRFVGPRGVRITLDGQKLSQKYHGSSYNYWGDGALGRMQYLNPEMVGKQRKFDANVSSHVNDETEDRVWSYTATLEDARDYILRVDVCLPDDSEIVDYDARIAKAREEGKDAIVKSLESKKEVFIQELEEIRGLVYALKRTLKDKLFIYTDKDAFAEGGKGNVEPEWLGDWKKYDAEYVKASSQYSNHSNVRTRNTSARAWAAALAIMTWNSDPRNENKEAAAFSKKYGLDYLLSKEVFHQMNDCKWRYRNDIGYVVGMISPMAGGLSVDREEIAKIQNAFTHWMRSKGYNDIRDVVREGKEIKKVRQGMIAYEEVEPDYEIAFEGPDASDYAHVVNEETNPEDVDLSSFEIKKKLNPKFWKNNRLDSRVRMKLLDIADDFTDFLNITWVDPEDITMTGSLANYTWDEQHSDIDLHIIMDYKKVDDRKDFVKNYFDSKKKEWNEKHKDLKIYGFPVEVYVQDKNEPHKSSGVYSLETDKWVTEPDIKNFSDDDFNEKKVKTSVSDYMNRIDDIEDEFVKTDDEHKIEKCHDEAAEVFDNIKDERKSAFSKSDKERSDGNVIFKTLRRNGYIEKISNLKNKAYDKLNSLN